MIDPARGIAADRCIDHTAVVQLEQEGVVRIRRVAVGTPLGFVDRNTLAAIFNDAAALANRASREHAATVNHGIAHDVGQRLACRTSGHWMNGTRTAETDCRMPRGGLDCGATTVVE